ncbi:MDR family MFS transporter [Staphylococcus lutrae]|uniref:MFS transporter n=1 Tax=Staphylococcus lutrae TaxID=155085 RepID=A0AAC9RVM5_9STAP|nr:MFS transporter [Staphylococcus lutrae]ARJ51762.1 MFS transporter [Staphylococcus lutrae]PNZ35154.1 MFS transporter [Staphylococcus lutrae]
MVWGKLSITLKVRLISNFFQELITTAFLPFIALYLTDMSNAKIAGTFLTILVLVNFPISLLGGYFVEILPKKKLVLIYQLIMGVMLLFISLSLIDNSNVVFFCCCYTVYNIVWGLQYPAMDTIIMDAITPDVENYIYKIDYWLTNLAMAFGALLGGLLYSNNKSLLFFIAFFVFILVFLALLKWIPKDEVQHINIKKSPKNLSSIFKSYEVVFKDLRFIVMILGFSLIMMGELSASSYISVRLKEEFNPIFSLNIDGVKMYSLLMVINTFIVITFTYFISKVILSMHQKYALIIGLSMYIIGYSNLTYLNNFYLLVLFMIIATIGEIIYAPIFDESRFKIIPDDKRGTYSAFNSLGFNLSELIARFGIVLGVFLSSELMGVYMFVLLSLGAIFIYYSIYGNFKARKGLKY